MIGKELDTLIERRSPKGEKTADELEAGYVQSVRRYNARRRKEIRAEWYGFFCRMADSLRARAEEYDRRAEALMEPDRTGCRPGYRGEGVR